MLRGVGDLVALTVGLMGIKPCQPCKQRQEWLNEHFPLKPRFLEEERDVNQKGVVGEGNHYSKLTEEQVKEIWKVHPFGKEVRRKRSARERA
mgnify:CR=1 FL=1